MLAYLAVSVRAMYGKSARAGDPPEGLSFPGFAALRTKTTLSWPKLVPEQDDMEEFHLCSRGADGLIPWIPTFRAMVFGSFGRRCIGEKKIGKVGWLTRPKHIIK